MPTTSFYIDAAQTNGSGQQKIMLRLSHKGKAYRYSTQQSVPPDLWDAAKKRVKKHNRHGVRGTNTINAILNNIEDTAIAIFEDWLKAKKYPPSNEEFRVALNEELGRVAYEEEEKQITLYQFWNETMESMEGNVVPVTVITYKRALRYIQEMAIYEKVKAFNFPDITFSWYDRFFNFCTLELDLDPVSIGALLSKLKAVLRRAEDRHSDINLPQDYKRFKVVKDGYGEAIYLSIDELTLIHQLEIADKTTDITRDLFLIGAFTGYRYGDFSSITAANIHDGMLIRTPQKTIKNTRAGRKVYTPLHPIIQQILKKYDYKLPKGISNQHSNEYIKEIAKLAGINTPTEKISCTRGQIVTEIVPKYEAQCTHRRFAW